MAGFRKAKAEQAALKVGVYGPPGSGKTFTSLLLAEGLAAITKKRIAYVDTERGTDFYCKAVKERPIHPEAFDFDAIYTRSMSEILDAVKPLSADEYGVLVVDSITHVWEPCRNAYSGKQTRAGTIPMQAWGSIKKPYKELMTLLLSSPIHVFILGRQGVDYEEDEETGELKAAGKKMKAEGETPYEPHILLRMNSTRPAKAGQVAKIECFVEKDRTGVLQGKTFVNPTFEAVCAPLLGLLGGTQAHISTDDENAATDAEALSSREHEREQKSTELMDDFSARIKLAKSDDELKAVGKTITPEIKKQMLAAHVASVREQYQDREAALSGRAIMSGAE